MCEALSGALERLVLTKDINQDIIKTRNTSYGFTETRKKDHWKIIFVMERERMEHTL